MCEAVIAILQVELPYMFRASSLRQFLHLLLHTFPVGFLQAEFVAVTIALNSFRIVFEGMRLIRQRYFLASYRLVVCRNQVIGDNTPRNTVHSYMMTNEQEHITCRKMINRHLHQRTVLQVDRRMEFACVRSNLILTVDSKFREVIELFIRFIDEQFTILRSQAQHVMVSDNSIHAYPQSLDVNRCLRLHRYALIIVFSMRQVHVEEIALNGTRHDFPCHHLLRYVVFHITLSHGSNSPDRLSLHHVSHSD